MTIKINKSETIQYFLALTFIINVFLSEISNYKPYSFYLKILSSSVLLVLCWMDYKYNSQNFNCSLQIDIRRIAIIITLFILIPMVSILYSYNAIFGIMKMGYLLISIIPSIAVFLYFLISADSIRIKIFINTILFVGIIFGIVSLILSPYNHAVGYSFELSRWSHVIAGRLLSSITVIIFLLHFSKSTMSKKFLITATTILMISTYFVGMRAALLGIIIFLVLLIIIDIVGNEKRAFSSILTSVIISMIVIFAVSKINKIPAERYNKLLTIENGEFDDGAITARFIAYKESWVNIKKFPIIGVGFGGFNSSEVVGEIAAIKYPHNLIIEIQLEMGIIGTIFFGVLFSLMFWKAKKLSIPLLIFLLFSFWLAMFSKDIATQTQLWIGIAVLGIKKK